MPFCVLMKQLDFEKQQRWVFLSKMRIMLHYFGRYNKRVSCENNFVVMILQSTPNGIRHKRTQNIKNCGIYLFIMQQRKVVVTFVFPNRIFYHIRQETLVRTWKSGQNLSVCKTHRLVL